MLCFINRLRQICFFGQCGCSNDLPDVNIQGGVVNNGIYVTHNGDMVVYNGA